MTGIDGLLREPAAQAIGWALLHFVWQGALVGLLAAIALRALRDSAADVRYVVGAVALSLMATMPVVTGVQAWRASGRRLVQGLNVPSKVFGERALHDLKTPQIAAHDLQARIEANDDMVIVDSRTPEEYARGCIPGAVSVPGGELVLRLPELVRAPTTTIVVHCGGRTRSYIGAESVRRMRLPNPVVALENGTMGWELAGLSLERGAERRPPPISPRSRATAALTAKRVAAEHFERHGAFARLLVHGRGDVHVRPRPRGRPRDHHEDARRDRLVAELEVVHRR